MERCRWCQQRIVPFKGGCCGRCAAMVLEYVQEGIDPTPPGEERYEEMTGASISPCDEEELEGFLI